LWILQEGLRLIAQTGLIQHADLIGVIPGIAVDALTHILANQLHRQRKLTGRRQVFRQRADIRRRGWRILCQRTQGVGRSGGIALLQIAFGIGHLRIEVGALRQFTHPLILTAARNTREQGVGG